MSILLVEDSAIDRHQIARHLDEWHLDFRAVGDGIEAWDLLQKPEAPDLILLDWMLPGIDGIDLCQDSNIRRRWNVLLYRNADCER